MSSVRIQRTYPDGSLIEVEVYADSSYPDALDQAKTVAVSAYLALPDVEVGE